MEYTTKQIAKALNRHHERYCAGFYGSRGGRFFQARVKDGALEVSPDFERWIPAGDMDFLDHNGRRLS